MIVSLFDGGSPRAGGAPPAGRSRAKLRYHRVIELVERIIADQGLQPGDLLPTQKELAGMAGVSLITVRRALDELAREGLVVGHQGVGTFVARPRLVSRPVSQGGLLATLAPQGGLQDVHTQVLQARLAAPRQTVARALGLAAGEHVWQIVRLRLTGERPLMVEQALVPERLAPDLGARRTTLEGSLYASLSTEYGLADDHEEQYLEVRAAGAQDRKLLALSSRAQVVRIRGISFTASGVAFDCFEHVYPAEEFVFYISGQTASTLLRPADLQDWGVTASGRKP